MHADRGDLDAGTHSDRCDMMFRCEVGFRSAAPFAPALRGPDLGQQLGQQLPASPREGQRTPGSPVQVEACFGESW